MTATATVNINTNLTHHFNTSTSRAVSNIPADRSRSLYPLCRDEELEKSLEAIRNRPPEIPGQQSIDRMQRGIDETQRNYDLFKNALPDDINPSVMETADEILNLVRTDGEKMIRKVKRFMERNRREELKERRRRLQQQRGRLERRQRKFEGDKQKFEEEQKKLEEEQRQLEEQPQ